MRTIAIRTLLVTLFGLLVLGAPAASRGASLPMDSTAADPNHFDYAVPDAPALQMITANPKAILRPGTRRELAVMAEEADLKNFALECAPFLLARDGQISLRDYKRWGPLYNLRLSVGANTKEGAPTTAAVGLRLSLMDSNDPYGNKKLEQAAAFADDLQRNRTKAQDSLRVHLANRDPAYLDLLSKDERADYLKDLPAAGPVEAFAGLGSDEIERLVDFYIRKYYRDASLEFKNRWNRNLLEIATATSFVGSDPTGNSVHALAFSGWIAGGLAIQDRGQLLVGLNAGVLRDSLTHLMHDQSGAAGLRLYYGSNAVKADAGFDLKGTKDRPSAYSGEAGAEIQLLSSIWLVPSVTLSHSTGHRAELGATFSVRYATLGAIPVFEKLAK